MSRIDVLQQRMFDVMPVSPVMPIQGPRLARTRIYAGAVAGDASMLPTFLGVEGQAEQAEIQLNESAYLVRIDLVQPPPIPTPPDPLHPTPIAADDWTFTQSPFWLFAAENTANPGATGVFLDRWGRTLQVPRYTSESDTKYAKRIISETILPANTNIGIAVLVDDMLGLTDSYVIEASSFNNLSLIRYDDSLRMDDGLRYSAIHLFNAPSYWNCFVLFISVDLPYNGYTNEDITNLINRHKSAGNRKIATVTPNYVFPDQ
jgi:hypothetical protein